MSQNNKLEDFKKFNKGIENKMKAIGEVASSLMTDRDNMILTLHALTEMGVAARHQIADLHQIATAEHAMRQIMDLAQATHGDEENRFKEKMN